MGVVIHKGGECGDALLNALQTSESAAVCLNVRESNRKNDCAAKREEGGIQDDGAFDEVRNALPIPEGLRGRMTVITNWPRTNSIPAILPFTVLLRRRWKEIRQLQLHDELNETEGTWKRHLRLSSRRVSRVPIYA